MTKKFVEDLVITFIIIIIALIEGCTTVVTNSKEARKDTTVATLVKDPDLINGKEPRRGYIPATFTPISEETPDIHLEKYDIDIFFGSSPCKYTREELEREMARVLNVLSLCSNLSMNTCEDRTYGRDLTDKCYCGQDSIPLDEEYELDWTIRFTVGQVGNNWNGATNLETRVSYIKVLFNPNSGECLPVNQIPGSNRNTYGHELGHAIIFSKSLYIKADGDYVDTADTHHSMPAWVDID